jgi:NarL family two-component system sensor histidine kinase YdfH
MDLAALSDVAAGACPQGGRIVAEALGNVARHARARAVTLSARSEGCQIVLVVEDDGIGFDLELEQARPGHYGLMGMRERARLLGGSLQVDAAPGQGTRVQLYLPRRKAGAGA